MKIDELIAQLLDIQSKYGNNIVCVDDEEEEIDVVTVNGASDDRYVSIMLWSGD